MPSKDIHQGCTVVRKDLSCIPRNFGVVLCLEVLNESDKRRHCCLMEDLTWGTSLRVAAMVLGKDGPQALRSSIPVDRNI